MTTLKITIDEKTIDYLYLIDLLERHEIAFEKLPQGSTLLDFEINVQPNGWIATTNVTENNNPIP
jgi:hypothetical protein